MSTKIAPDDSLPEINYNDIRNWLANSIASGRRLIKRELLTYEMEPAAYDEDAFKRLAGIKRQVALCETAALLLRDRIGNAPSQPDPAEVDDEFFGVIASLYPHLDLKPAGAK